MKFLLTGDWHSDHFTAGVRRHEDVSNAALQVVEIAKQRSVSEFVFLGDLTDPEVGAFHAQSLAIEVARKLSYHMGAGGIRQHWLTGNHDVVEDSYGTHTLLPLAAAGFTVYDQPRARKLRGSNLQESEIWLVAFPYVSTARSYDPVAEARRMRGEIPQGAQVVVVSHLMLEGIAPGSETTDMARGRDLFLPLDELRELFPGVEIFSGHYHQAQTYRGVHLPGSLIRLTKGEVGNVAGFLIADIG